MFKFLLKELSKNTPFSSIYFMFKKKSNSRRKRLHEEKLIS